MNTRGATRQYRMSQWAGVFREQKSSGLTITAWCEQNGISRQQYFYWQRRLRESACEELALRTESKISTIPTFAEINVKPDLTGAIVVRMNGTEVEIRNGTSPELAAKVLNALKTQC